MSKWNSRSNFHVSNNNTPASLKHPFGSKGCIPCMIHYLSFSDFKGLNESGDSSETSRNRSNNGGSTFSFIKINIIIL